MDTDRTALERRIDMLALEARRIADDVQFRAGLVHCRGELTMTHVHLESARGAIARAKEAIDAVADQAERYRLEAAPSEQLKDIAA